MARVSTMAVEGSSSPVSSHALHLNECDADESASSLSPFKPLLADLSEGAAEDCVDRSRQPPQPSQSQVQVPSERQEGTGGSSSTGAVAQAVRKRKRRTRVTVSVKRARGGSGVSQVAGVDEAYEYGREYEIEKIIARRNRGGQCQYQIRWKGYSAAHDTWEPADNLTLHARQWFEQEMESGLRDKRSGRLKHAAHWRNATAAERQQQHDSQDATAEAATRSGPTYDETEESNAIVEVEAEGTEVVAGQEADSEQPQADRGKEESCSSHSALLVHSSSSTNHSSAPVAAVGLSVGRQRRSIRPPRPYSPSHYVSTTRKTKQVPERIANRTRRAIERSDEWVRPSSDGGDDTEGRLLDSDTEEAVSANVGSQSKAASLLSKHAAVRQHPQLHVSVRRVEVDDVIDLATPTDVHSAAQPHNDATLHTAAADSVQHDEHEVTDEQPAAGEETAVEVSECHSGGCVDSDVDKAAAAVTQSPAELTYEVEAVVDRRFSPASIAPGCCIVQASSAGGEDTQQAENSFGSHSVLPDDEWDQGCSGNAMQHSTQRSKDRTLRAHSPPSRLLAPSQPWLLCCPPGFEYRIKWCETHTPTH